MTWSVCGAMRNVWKSPDSRNNRALQRRRVMIGQ
jgi:hypothetical protein